MASGSEKLQSPAGTRERLLAAAERLLLTERYDEVSVRGICAAAGANPAAVHYHFGSKEALVAALLEDRLGELWDARLTALAARGASVPEVVDAVIEPFVELAADPVGRLHLRLLAQFVLGRPPLVWTRPWFRIDTWDGLLPGPDAQEGRRRLLLAFNLIIMRFGAVEARGSELSANSVATLRDFVIAGLIGSTGEDR
ncbi:TetR/AcrR family transcriptional regulator [Nocardia sp. NEAU-G5]|uniref:TetR/AcrR family transcriptional regulator n=1 Tax=Nocardia albiluteola TaxID=2842303 RepID=A0ABS6AUY6_9NOCA|nr:TetR/AcrR family transcriptional regulator [Nocardia albiluteola]MBU3061832.1 TetR/AcrR family transcriptional regulator [Nocardia albiluteola]